MRPTGACWRPCRRTPAPPEWSWPSGCTSPPPNASAACAGWRRRGWWTGYGVRLDRRRLGLDVVAFVQVSLARHGDDPAAGFHRALAAMPEVLEAHAITGDADYLLRVVAPDLEAFSDVVLKRLLALPGVATVRSSLSLGEIKGDRRAAAAAGLKRAAGRARSTGRRGARAGGERGRRDRRFAGRIDRPHMADRGHLPRPRSEETCSGSCCPGSCAAWRWRSPPPSCISTCRRATWCASPAPRSSAWDVDTGELRDGAQPGATRDVRFINAVTETGATRVYRNEDTGWGFPPYLKFDSADITAQSQDLAGRNAWVLVEHYGWRIRFPVDVPQRRRPDRGGGGLRVFPLGRADHPGPAAGRPGGRLHRGAAPGSPACTSRSASPAARSGSRICARACTASSSSGARACATCAAPDLRPLKTAAGPGQSPDRRPRRPRVPRPGVTSQSSFRPKEGP